MFLNSRVKYEHDNYNYVIYWHQSFYETTESKQFRPAVSWA